VRADGPAPRFFYLFTSIASCTTGICRAQAFKYIDQLGVKFVPLHNTCRGERKGILVVIKEIHSLRAPTSFLATSTTPSKYARIFGNTKNPESSITGIKNRTVGTRLWGMRPKYNGSRIARKATVWMGGG